MKKTKNGMATMMGSCQAVLMSIVFSLGLFGGADELGHAVNLDRDVVQVAFAEVSLNLPAGEHADPQRCSEQPLHESPCARLRSTRRHHSQSSAWRQHPDEFVKRSVRVTHHVHRGVAHHAVETR